MNYLNFDNLRKCHLVLDDDVKFDFSVQEMSYACCAEPTKVIGFLGRMVSNEDALREMRNKSNEHNIKNVIFNNPATIVYWKDGSKTIVKCQDGDTYNEELGLAMCIVKKLCGNNGNYNDVFKKWLPKEVDSGEI